MDDAQENNTWNDTYQNNSIMNAVQGGNTSENGA